MACILGAPELIILLKPSRRRCGAVAPGETALPRLVTPYSNDRDLG